VVIGAETAGLDHGIGVDEGAGFFDGADVHDEDAAVLGVVAKGAGHEDFAFVGEAVDVVEVGFLEFVEFGLGEGLGLVAAQEEYHDVLLHDVGGVAFGHGEFAGILGRVGLGGEESGDEEEEEKEVAHGENVKVWKRVKMQILGEWEGELVLADVEGVTRSADFGVAEAEGVGKGVDEAVGGRVVVAVVAPGEEDGGGVLGGLEEEGSVVGAFRFRGGKQVFGLGGPEGEDVGDVEAVVAPALSEVDATADGGVVVGGVGGGGVEADDVEGPGTGVPLPLEAVAVLAAGGELGGGGEEIVHWGHGWWGQVSQSKWNGLFPGWGRGCWSGLLVMVGWKTRLIRGVVQLRSGF